jgi:uncharacterized lipoprotein YbaY
MVNQGYIYGKIIVENANSIQNPTVYIRLEDTSEEDAPSKILAQKILKNIIIDSTANTIPFTFNMENPDKRVRYTVSVFIDVNKNGKPDRGDYINMESYPVLTFGSPNYIEIKVKQII